MIRCKESGRASKAEEGTGGGRGSPGAALRFCFFFFFRGMGKTSVGGSAA